MALAQASSVMRHRHRARGAWSIVAEQQLDREMAMAALGGTASIYTIYRQVRTSYSLLRLCELQERYGDMRGSGQGERAGV